MPDLDYTRIVAVTNRHICYEGKKDIFENGEAALLAQIKRLTDLGVSGIVLREKDMQEDDYEILARRAIEICAGTDTRLILHHFTRVAIRLNYSHIQLPYDSFLKETDKNRWQTLGTSVHSIEDAIKAESLGAAYLVAGHVFATDCKKGLPPRGIKFLEEICETAHIPVYAIGGITTENIQDIYSAGAKKACIMSGLMRI